MDLPPAGPAARDSLGDLLVTLTALPHRGSATLEEARAADILEAYLLAAGHAVDRQRFHAPRTYGWELLVISVLLALGGLAPVGWIALAGALWFFAYFSGWWTPPLFDRYRSQNLIGRAGNGPRTLVLMAHYDSAKTFFLYDPRRVRSFRANFLLNAVLAGLTVPLSLLWWPGSIAAGLYFLVQAALLLYREVTAPYVNGANDNASGVAVAVRLFLDLATAVPDGWQIALALTGCEEVGARGARALLRSGELPAGSLILNVDNVGRGDLFYAEGEGMLGYHRFSGPLLDAARSLGGARPVQYRLAYFDTLPFARAGFPCLTLIRLTDGVPPNWHWPTDVRANVDGDAVEGAFAYARDLALRVLGGEDQGVK